MSSLDLAKINIPLENPDLKMMLRFEISKSEVIEKLLSVSDLTNSTDESHIIKTIFENLLTQLKKHNFENIKVVRDNSVVSALDNFDNLLFSPGNPGRSSTYTRYVDSDSVLRTHTSSLVPKTFRDFIKSTVRDNINTFVFPGLAYRRDVIDPRHLDVFHQIDIWTLQKNNIYPAPTRENLLSLVKCVFESACPGAEMKYYEAIHPYTINGIEVYAKINDTEIEVLECGIIHPEVLKRAGIDPNEYSGLALGMGLERLIMARKNLPDIRLIRSTDPRIRKQMTNLEPYVIVSNMPAISRDISYATNADYSEEDICEDIRNAFSEKSYLIEEVIILSRTKHELLHNKAQEKLGTTPGMDNALVRIVLRHPDVTLTKEEANELYSIAYPKIHKGAAQGYPQ